MFVLIREKILHSAFWVFTFLYVLDYLIDILDIWDALFCSTFEVSILALEFYIHLYILIPKYLSKRKRGAYGMGLLLLISGGFALYEVSGLTSTLLGTTFLGASISYTLNHSFFLFISYMLWQSQKYWTQKNRAVTLEKDKLALELKLLKSQISPHFLFNTLNNIYALAVTQSPQTPNMIEATSEVLRYYSQNGGKETIPLSDEMRAVERYLDLQTLRKLQGTHTLKSPDAQDLTKFQIPPFVLLTLVENAFKHGDVTLNSAGFVNINISVQGESALFSVENSHNSVENDGGIGLQNIEHQLKLLFGESGKPEVKRNDKHYHVQVILHEKH